MLHCHIIVRAKKTNSANPNRILDVVITNLTSDVVCYLSRIAKGGLVILVELFLDTRSEENDLQELECRLRKYN